MSDVTLGQCGAGGWGGGPSLGGGAGASESSAEPPPFSPLSRPGSARSFPLLLRPLYKRVLSAAFPLAPAQVSVKAVLKVRGDVLPSAARPGSGTRGRRLAPPGQAWR